MSPVMVTGGVESALQTPRTSHTTPACMRILLASLFSNSENSFL